MSIYEPLHRKMLARVAERREGHPWYEIKAQADEGKAVVRIYDEISQFGVTAEDFVNDLDGITASEIEVQINSPGGSVFDGLAIFNALRTHRAHITTRVDGIAASAASVIVQAGDHRVMVESAQQMIHEAWGAHVGPADEFREYADLLDKQNGVIAEIYAARSDKSADEFRDLMTVDTYLTDEESVGLGLADEIHRPPRKKGQNAARSGDVAASVTRKLTADRTAAAVAARLRDRTKPDLDAAAIARGIAAALKRDDG